MGIGDSRQITLPIAGGSGYGSGTFGTSSEQSAFVDARDGTAAGADSLNIQHGYPHGNSIKVSFSSLPRRAFREAHICRCAAHIEREDPIES